MSEAKKINLFAIGDVVQLASGGPIMTVEEILPPVDSKVNDLVVSVEWFDSAQHIHSYHFFSKQLVNVVK